MNPRLSRTLNAAMTLAVFAAGCMATARVTGLSLRQTWDVDYRMRRATALERLLIRAWISSGLYAPNPRTVSSFSIPRPPWEGRGSTTFEVNPPKVVVSPPPKALTMFHRLILYAVLLGPGLIAAIAVNVWLTGRLIRRLQFRCVRCGYPLAGWSDPLCPECGTPFDLPGRARG